MSTRLTAAEDSRSSHNAAGRPVTADKFSAQSRAACAAGPIVPSMLNGNPTTSPPTPSLRAMARISAAFCFSFPRFRLP